MSSRKIEVFISGDAAALEKAFGRAGKSASGFERGIGKASKAAVGAFAALGLGAKVGFDELAEAQLVGAQTAAVLESTGGAANVTATEIEKLAGALSAKTGVDDEAIQSGQNMLLTFTKIRNEVGAGNAIFDQATQATLDLSVAMGKDMQSSAILVGKALNDPIKGMSALSKAGIQFTEEQKESIKTMVESGNAMGAQKMILKELETQFGGSAVAAGTTLTGSINKAKNAFSEMAAGLVEALLPSLTKFAEKVGAVSTFLTKHETATKVVIVALASLATGVLAVNAALKLQAAAAAIGSVAFLGLGTSATVADKMMRLTLIGGLITLGTAIVIAYQKSETFRDIVNAVFNSIRNTVVGAISFILGAVDKFLAGIQKMAEVASKLPFIGDKFKGIASAVGDAREKVQGLQSAIDGLKSKEITITTNLRTYGSTAADPSLGVIGRRAHGGPVSAGAPYMVGERGPELFVPGRSGTIVPNGGGGGASSAPSGDLVLMIDGEAFGRIARKYLDRASARNVALELG